MTGAARGLREAIAQRLHADEWGVALADVDLAGAERVAAELGESTLPVLPPGRPPRPVRGGHGLVAFLLSDAGFVRGGTFDLNDGMLMRRDRRSTTGLHLLVAGR